MWSPTRPDPGVPGQGWTGATRPDPTDPPRGWGLVVVRTLTGHELAQITEAGVTRLGSLVGEALTVARDAGLVTVRDLGGTTTASVRERAATAPALTGAEVAATLDRGTVGAWTRTDVFTSIEHSLVVPPRLSGIHAVTAEDSGRITASGRGRTVTSGSDHGTGEYHRSPGSVDEHTSTVTIPIPPAVRYIDIIALSGGGGGAGGTQGAPGWDGNGGGAGQYAARRWDRGTGRNTWQTVTITIGGGGAGGRNNGSAGTAGGASVARITNLDGSTVDTLTAPGGTGGSGTSLGGGVSGAQNGKAPGNHTFQGITATGGGQNSGTPGGGGRGGTGAFWPTNPGSGNTGARGQAWIRFTI